MSLLAALTLSLLAAVSGQAVKCANTRAGVWTCPASSVRNLSFTPTQRWFTLGQKGWQAKESYASTWIDSEGYCCRYCIWDLSYP